MPKKNKPTKRKIHLRIGSSSTLCLNENTTNRTPLATVYLDEVTCGNCKLLAPRSDVLAKRTNELTHLRRGPKKKIVHGLNGTTTLCRTERSAERTRIKATSDASKITCKNCLNLSGRAVSVYGRGPSGWKPDNADHFEVEVGARGFGLSNYGGRSERR